MPGMLNRWRVSAWASEMMKAAHRVRGPLLASLACCAALVLVPQAREIIRTLALDAGEQTGVITVTALALLMLMAGLWALCWSADADGGSRVIQRILAAACAALPAAGAAIGSLRAGLEMKPIDVGQPQGAIDTSIVAALAQTSALPGTLQTVAMVLVVGGAQIPVPPDHIDGRRGPRPGRRAGVRRFALADPDDAFFAANAFADGQAPRARLREPVTGNDPRDAWRLHVADAVGADQSAGISYPADVATVRGQQKAYRGSGWRSSALWIGERVRDRAA